MLLLLTLTLLVLLFNNAPAELITISNGMNLCAAHQHASSQSFIDLGKASNSIRVDVSQR